MGKHMRRAAALALGMALTGLGAMGLTSCGDDALAAEVQQVPGGNAAQGRQAIVAYGCGSCHTIAGVPGANGQVGPPLTGVGGRAYIAGMLPNTPENLITWIQNPQAVVPGNAMPNLGVSEGDARDIAAYLATLVRQPR